MCLIAGKGTKLTIVFVLPATISRTGTLMPHVKAKVLHFRSTWQLINDGIVTLYLLLEKLAENESRQELVENKSRQQSACNNFFFAFCQVFCLFLLICLTCLPSPKIHSLSFLPSAFQPSSLDGNRALLPGVIFHLCFVSDRTRSRQQVQQHKKTVCWSSVPGKVLLLCSAPWDECRDISVRASKLLSVFKASSMSTGVFVGVRHSWSWWEWPSCHQRLGSCCGVWKQFLLWDIACWALAALCLAGLLIFLCPRQHSLMVLMERMYSANPHFVRCIKPNSQKEPGVMDSQVVLLQVRKSSVLHGYFYHILLGKADHTERTWR